MREDTVEELWNAIADGDGSEEEDAVGDLSRREARLPRGRRLFQLRPEKTPR